jgi:5'-3' exonuclease
MAVDRVEADDVIAVLAKNYHESERVLIVSNDKDFQQLQRYPNVEQYSLMKKQFLVCDNPEKFLMEHIIKGDSSDGIPNVLSDAMIDQRY